MTTLTVSKSDILNSELTPLPPNTDGSYYFTTQTDSGFRGLKTTFLKPATNSRVYTPLLGGSINWREKTFEIGGVVKKWETLKHRLGSVFRTFPYVEIAKSVGNTDNPAEISLTEWCWTDRRYAVKRANKQWTVRSNFRKANPCTTY